MLGGILRARRSARPAKQLLWFEVQRALDTLDLTHSTVVDAACGEMDFYPRLRPAGYTGIDIDRDRIRQGLIRFPAANGIVSDLRNIPESVEGDAVLCLQTLGLNAKFESKDLWPVANGLVAATRAGGVLLVNIRRHEHPDGTVELHEFERFLRTHFEHVYVRRYGRFNKPLPAPIAFALAFAMFWVPRLARPRAGGERECAFYVAKNRKKES